VKGSRVRGIKFFVCVNGCVSGSLVCVIRSLECVSKYVPITFGV